MSFYQAKVIREHQYRIQKYAWRRTWPNAAAP